VRRPSKLAHYRLIGHPAITDDLAALAAYGPEVVTALRVALDDLAHGRVTGKALGVRHVSGDLTGLASVKFDLPGSPTRRFTGGRSQRPKDRSGRVSPNGGTREDTDGALRR